MGRGVARHQEGVTAMTATGIGHISRYGRTFYVLCVAVVAWQCFVMALDTLHGGVGQMLHEGRMAVVAAANALLLLAPYWLLPRRWRWAVWIPSALLTLWCLMQMCYCRAYDDLMPWQSLTLTDNVNSTLASSTVALMRWQDLLVLLPFLALIAAHLLSKRHASGREGILRPLAITLAAGLLLAALGYTGGDTNYRKRLLHNFSNREYFARNGLIPYGLFTLHEAMSSHHVTDSEREALQRFLQHDCPHYSDNRFAARERQNLVLIIVESLHTWPIGMRVDGREVTPVLNRLVASDSVIYAPHVLFQTSHGHSSDAHFIYNTGLLPLRDGVVAVNWGAGPYPSIAQALDGYDCREVICTPGVNWNQNVTARAYGFDTLYTRTELMADGAFQRHGNVDDAALTDFAARLLPSLRQPFFLEMVTMTMHTPYPTGKVRPSWITASDTLSAEARGYLNCVNLTDSCIGALIGDLHRMGLYDRTVLAIVSDHTQVYLNRVKGLTDYQAVPDDWSIPLIITHATASLRYEPIIGQVDVFPTLLDVMGANGYQWKGLGHSILRYPVTSAIQPRNMSILGDSTALTPHQLQAWDMSRLMILDRAWAR